MPYVHMMQARHGTLIYPGCCWYYVRVPKEDSAVLSAELVTGSPLILPGQLHMPDPPPVDMLAPPMRPAYMRPAAHLARAEHVYVGVGGQQKPLAAPYASPAPEDLLYILFICCICLTGGGHGKSHDFKKIQEVFHKCMLIS